MWTGDKKITKLIFVLNRFMREWIDRIMELENILDLILILKFVRR